MPRVVSLFLSLWLLSCSGSGPKDTGGHKTTADFSAAVLVFEPAQGKILRAQPLVIASSEVIQDAFDYTLGSLDVTPVANGIYTLKGRYLYASRLSELTGSSALILAQLCQAMGIYSDGTGTRVWWRSHHTQARMEALASAVAAGHRDLHCVMHIENQNGLPFYLSFDPLPVSDADVLGSAVAKKAVQSSLMMLNVKSGLVLAPLALLKIVDLNPQFDTVRALGASSHTPLYSMETGAPCAFAAGSQTVVSNTDLLKQSSVSFEGVQLKAATPVAIAGKRLKACSGVSIQFKDDQAQFGFTCGTYQATKNEGLEAGCQWGVLLGNDKDPEDEITVTLGMPRLSYLGSMSRGWMSGKDAVVKSPINPIRLKSIALNGFSVSQLSFLEKAFDVILEVSPDVYRQDFAGYMKSASLGTTGACAQPGVMGYASVGGNSITLCQYMFGSGVDSPSAVVGAAHTIVHEVRHARGFFHDIDRPAYEPCGGTAFANVFDHNIVAVCTSAFCPLLKSSAEGSYLNDINYSLKGDDRRFLGLCKQWQTNMGFTDARVRAGR
ncbi:MAG: hypothetical protein EOP10_14190 [Proteobacteria bacterium]|nr:MAG: hypothetical protein EOP10_14190 [Pseudomonadota bacterium]